MTPIPSAGLLTAESITVRYHGRDSAVLDDLSVRIEPGTFTVIVGGNGCGKSTMLRALARVLKPSAGTVALDGRDVARMASKEFARQVALLPQGSIAPPGVTVGDLVARGRYPHQGLLRQWSQADEDAVAWALERTSTTELEDRQAEDLSGGQRQRVWIAMALAQQTPILLLDEPTTYLDLAHQIDVLELTRDLVTAHGRTVVAVLHDLNHACRYADRIIAMRDGAVVASDSPAAVITPELVENVFGLRCRVIDDPVTGTPLVVPEQPVGAESSYEDA